MFDEFSPDNEPKVAKPDKSLDDNPPRYFPSEPPTWVNNQPIAVSPLTMSEYATEKRLPTPPPPPPMSRDSAARDRVRKRKVRGRVNHGGEWAWVIIAAAMFAVVLVVSFAIFVLLRTSQEEIEVIPTAVVILPTPIDARTDFTASSIGEQLLLPDGTSIEIKPWDGQSRFTMVMVGLDRRPGETGLAYRTDTIMLISLDPVNNTLGLLSIPRDLFVQIPGYAEPQRVNSAMVYGENRQVGYGPRLLMETVQYNLGIRVNDYLAVDFQAFIDVVDLIGGVDIENEYTINDTLFPDMNYGYDPFYLPAGTHHLDGRTALKFARTRHGDNDFERARRQQEVMFAIRDRISQPDTLANMLFRAPELWKTVNQNVYTGLTLEQVVQLGLYAKDIPQENITVGVIDGKYIRPYTTLSGASVLIPDRANIGNLMVEIFGGSYSQ